MRSRVLRALIPAMSLLAVGCYANDSMPPGEAAPVVLTSGDAELRFLPDARSFTLSRGGVDLLRFPVDALELGLLPAVDDDTNYDPTAVVAPTALHAAPEGLTWVAPERLYVGAPATEGGVLAIDATLTYPEQRVARLRVEATRAGSFRLVLRPDAPHADRVAYLRLRPRADAKEGFYGLGEQFDDVNQRGKVRAMQIEIDGATESGYNNVHVPIPFLLGTTGWGLFVESARPAVFSVATEAPDLVEALVGTGLASGEGLTFHLFAEDKPIDLTRHYHEVTGAPRLPARWALGPWVWRDESANQAQAEGDLQAMRDLDLPATGYWVDRPYARAVNTFDWDPGQFPAPAVMIDKAQDLGFGFALWHTPYLDKKADAAAALRAEAEEKGYHPVVSGLPLNPWGKLVDFTNPAAKAWWQELAGNYTSLGVEGWKLDYAEDVVPGVTYARNAWVFADGSDERTMHAGYQRVYHATYAELLPPSGGFLLCRAGMYGDQALGAIIWPGDLDASFARNKELVDEGGDSYRAVGGLPASIIAGLSLGPSGFPFYGADTGGYLHSPPDKELFTRWFQQTSLSTVMQIGNSASTVAWEPDPVTSYDEEMLGWYRTYTRLHLRLFPYEWTYAERLVTDGRPIARPLGLVYPELGQHPSDEYLFGDDLLVAPVLERGATSREVLLPAGRWIDWWTGDVVEGGGAITADAPLWKLPLYLREGGIIPMLRPSIDTLRPTTEPALVDSYGTDPGVLWARVAPGPESSFTVFDGATLGQKQGSDGVHLSAGDGSEFTRGVMFEVVGHGPAPSEVSEGGNPLAEAGSLDELTQAASGWVWVAEAGGTVYVKTAPGSREVLVAP